MPTKAEKPWYFSITIWAGIVALLNAAGLAGFAFDPLTGDFNGNIYELGASLVGFGSGALAIWGRIRAAARIK